MNESRTSSTRAVLLGASNLTRGFDDALASARAELGGPLDVFAALGHGRSYGMESHFLARSLPGIDACGLWQALERDRTRPTYALVTDVGNDVAFGVEPATIARWVELALARLERAGARIVVTALPLPLLERLPAWKFGLWRRFFFPGRGLERELLLERAREVDRWLRATARERGLALVEPDAAWYAADPIHIAMRHSARAWRAMLAPWGNDPHRASSETTSNGRAHAGELGWRRRLLVPEHRRLFGIAQSRSQPCARLADGSTIALY